MLFTKQTIISMISIWAFGIRHLSIYVWEIWYSYYSLPICALTEAGGYIIGFVDPIIDGTWWPTPTIELAGISIVVDVCDMFEGPRFPYGLGDGAYVP